MRYRSLFSAVVVSLFFISAVFGADKYQFDLAHTSIGFSVRHMVLSYVKGDFKDFSGTILLDEKDISKSSVEVTIKTASINTGNEKRDSDLKAEGFLEAEKYPEITFKSKRIEKNDDGYVAVGDLTLHGVTKEISLPFNLIGPIKDPWGNNRIGIQATLEINRQDYGVSWSKTMDNGGLIVGDEVKIELNVEAVNAQDGTN
jgi:polyisoprenoid-binding protein YceI